MAISSTSVWGTACVNTLVLLFIQFLRKYTHLPLLKWVNRLNPLFDSYLGPVKPKHHYWIGLGLLTRLVLLLTRTVTLTTIPFIATVTTILTALLLFILVQSVYKQWQLSALESCFLFNMAVFSSGALFIEAQDQGSKDVLACISLGLALIIFLAIVCYHVWRRCQCLRKRPRNTGKHKEAPAPASTSQSVELRESLLASDN